MLWVQVTGLFPRVGSEEEQGQNRKQMISVFVKYCTRTLTLYRKLVFSDRMCEFLCVKKLKYMQ